MGPIGLIGPIRPIPHPPALPSASTMRTRFICIHGHFYQPPRENPWLEAIETQDSAHPYHDWNERITAECYEPNASSRILDANDRIIKIVNNYASISFNFGPTLLSWLEQREPPTYAAILDADRVRRDRSDSPVHLQAAVRPLDHDLFLRWTDLARGGLRESAGARREPRASPSQRVLGVAQSAPARQHRDRRRNVRASSSLRRHGAGVRARLHQRAQT